MSQVFTFLSVGFLPVMSAVIIGYGLWKRAPIYDLFIEGAKNGLKTAVEIMPFLIGIFIAINSLTSSGILNLIDVLLAPALTALEVPAQLLPLMFLRAISGSGSMIILQDILENVGPDSYAGRVACVMAGGCETVIYVLALYFGVTKVKQMRHAFKGGLIGYITGIIVSIIICRFM
ncbi:MAG: nucleoside recognition domain-containing protein [Anaerovoracaceae bacterium]